MQTEPTKGSELHAWTGEDVIMTIPASAAEIPLTIFPFVIFIPNSPVYLFLIFPYGDGFRLTGIDSLPLKRKGS
jgi:hypothetical protein